MKKLASRKKLFNDRTAGRLTAVQALFQIEQTGASANEVVLEFLDHRLKDREHSLLKPNPTFFTKLVEGAWKIHLQSDDIIAKNLKSGWTLERLEPVTRAILRAALYEIYETTTPAPVIIDEYLNITHGFFNESEVAFVNGILNAIAQKVR